VGIVTEKNILHMVTSLKHMSPFDLNKARDASYDAVIPYTGVTLDKMTGLGHVDIHFSQIMTATRNSTAANDKTVFS
jgi:hypothetical protein